MQTIDYVNEYLLNCETNIDDCVAPINGKMEDIKIVDVLGTIEIDGRINMGLEVVTDDFPYGEIIHIDFINVWNHVYKDELIEIIETVSNKIGEKLSNKNMFNS